MKYKLKSYLKVKVTWLLIIITILSFNIPNAKSESGDLGSMWAVGSDGVLNFRANNNGAWTATTVSNISDIEWRDDSSFYARSIVDGSVSLYGVTRGPSYWSDFSFNTIANYGGNLRHLSLEIHNGNLWSVGSDGNIYELVGGVWTDRTSGVIYANPALLSFNGNLYTIDSSDDSVYRYDAQDTLTQTQPGTVMNLENINGQFIAVDANANRIWSDDTADTFDTWVVEIDPGVVDIEYNPNNGFVYGVGTDSLSYKADWDGTSAIRTWGADDFQIGVLDLEYGIIAPEPSSAIMALIGLSLFFFRRARGCKTG